MERITRWDIEQRIGTLNRCLEAAGSTASVVGQARNGAVALDQYRGNNCVALLAIGTKREIGAHLTAMLQAFALSAQVAS